MLTVCCVFDGLRVCAPYIAAASADCSTCNAGAYCPIGTANSITCPAVRCAALHCTAVVRGTDVSWCCARCAMRDARCALAVCIGFLLSCRRVSADALPVRHVLERHGSERVFQLHAVRRRPVLRRAGSDRHHRAVRRRLLLRARLQHVDAVCAADGRRVRGRRLLPARLCVQSALPARHLQQRHRLADAARLPAVSAGTLHLCRLLLPASTASDLVCLISSVPLGLLLRLSHSLPERSC
jgi:hypothetical protein